MPNEGGEGGEKSVGNPLSEPRPAQVIQPASENLFHRLVCCHGLPVADKSQSITPPPQQTHTLFYSNVP